MIPKDVLTLGKINVKDRKKNVAGLGLTISNKLAEYLGPERQDLKGIFVTTQLGEGSKFFFWIKNNCFENNVQDIITNKSNFSENISLKLIKEESNLTEIVPKITSEPLKNSFIKKKSNSNEIKNEIRINLEDCNSIEYDNNNNFSNEEIEIKEEKISNFTIASPKNISQKEKKFIDDEENRTKKNMDSFLSYKNINNSMIQSSVNERSMFLLIAASQKKLCECNDILIVDDNDFNILALKSLCERYGFSVEKETSGISAIENVQKKYKENTCCPLYKLIFMDIDMPIMNGYETTKNIVKFFNENNVNTPIVACSAFTGQNEIQKAIKSGMIDYLCKPVISSALSIIFVKYLQVESFGK